MCLPQIRKRQNIRAERLSIVAKCLRRQFSQEQIRQEVLRVMGIEIYTKATVSRDVKAVITHWQESELNETDKYVELELERIDEIVRELWSQWERSKAEAQTVTNVKRGRPSVNQKENEEGNSNDSNPQKIKTTGVEERKTTEQGLGDPRYLAEIRAHMAERRKLLGLYAPEKRDITSGGKSFSDFLIQSGIIEDAEPSDRQQIETD